ncbi:hypothetical protein INT47_000774, partial [Mucor saturninus]
MNNNTAIYSANFEESKTVENWSPLHDSKSNIIWEGHGLLSNILNATATSSQVTGKIANDTQQSASPYDCIIEVLIQLHPIRHSPTQEQQPYLPPMRSIWNQPYSPPSTNTNNNNNNSTSSNNNNNNINNNAIDKINIERPSPQKVSTTLSSGRQMSPLHLLQFPSQQQQQENTTPRLPSFLRGGPSEVAMKDESPNMYPPALDPTWPGSRYDATSFEQHDMMIKRRKLSSQSPSLLVVDPQHEVKKAVMATNNSHHHLLSNQQHPSPTTTDTYYHQSRRKKRDTKPPNANDIRPFVEVEKKDGDYVLPAEVDSWTVLSLGVVIWDRAAFHNQRYIYPVGYRVKKWYRSMVDPHSDTQYTCEILDGGDEPIFQLNADDNPSECWRGPTPTTVWTIAVRRAFAIRNMDYGHNPVGPDFFGLRKNTIAKMIQDLPNANKCKNYIWQNFEAMSNNKGKSVRRSTTRLSSSSSTGSVHPDRSSSSPAMKAE